MYPDLAHLLTVGVSCALRACFCRDGVLIWSECTSASNQRHCPEPTACTGQRHIIGITCSILDPCHPLRARPIIYTEQHVGSCALPIKCATRHLHGTGCAAALPLLFFAVMYGSRALSTSSNVPKSPTDWAGILFLSGIVRQPCGSWSTHSSRKPRCTLSQVGVTSYLAVWQIQRYGWKVDLLAKRAASLAREPQTLEAAVAALP